MKKTGYTHLFLLFFLMGGLFFSALPSYAEEPDLRSAKSLLEIPPKEALAQIKTLNAAQAAELITQIRYLVRPKNPDMDRVYFVLSHLENLRATALSQNRLNNLLWVLGLSLLLFSSFLVYIYLDQRRVLVNLQGMLRQERGISPQDKAPAKVYRGE